MSQPPQIESQIDNNQTHPKLATAKGADTSVNRCHLFNYLESSAIDFPSHAWLSFGNTTISYKEGLDLVERLATGLSAHGLTKGDRLVVCLPNDTFYPLFTYACWRQGIILVGVNSLYAKPMLTKIFVDARPKMIVTRNEPSLLSRVEQARDSYPEAKILALPQHGDAVLALSNPESTQPVSKDTLTFAALLGSHSKAPAIRLDPEEDIAVLQYTGGTTGSPKGAMLTHGNISSCVSQLCHGMKDLRRGWESYVVIGPFAHVIGTTLILATVTSIASEMVIESRFHPVDTVKLCIDRKTTVLFGVPTMFSAIAASPASQGADWSNLRYSMCGGAPLPRQIAVKFEDVTGCELLQGYGLSESAGGVAFSPPGLKLPDGAVGHPLAESHLQIRTLDDRTQIANIGDVGEICASGPQIMKGYWHAPEKTAEVMLGEFLATGDTGYIDDTGALHIVDRVKDLIIASGFNVYPSTIEDTLYTHPAIKEAAVIGVKDEYRGETVKAVISLNSGHSLNLEDLQTFLRPKLSPIEIPKLLEIRDELPKTAVGKISKLDLR